MLFRDISVQSVFQTTAIKPYEALLHSFRKDTKKRFTFLIFLFFKKILPPYAKKTSFCIFIFHAPARLIFHHFIFNKTKHFFTIMKKTATILSLLLVNIFAFAQTRLQGKVTDSKGEPIAFVTISLILKGVAKTGTVTDMDGNYLLSGIEPGVYDIEASEVSVGTKRVTGVTVLANRMNVVDIKFTEQAIYLKEEVVVAYKIPIIKADKTTKGLTIGSEPIRTLPTKNLARVAASAAGVSQADEGKGVSMRGSRETANEVYIDGVRMKGGQLPPAQNIESMEDIMGGVPASIGGIPNITSGAVNIVLAPKEAAKKSLPKTEEPKEGDTNDFNPLVENIFKEAKNEPLTTFSTDVDRASYTTTRALIEDSELPDKNAVRIEEFINYFDYHYEQPKGNDPIAISTEMASSPWNPSLQLVRIGLQAATIPISQLPASNLVFLIDVSGSMSLENRLPLVKKSLNLLVEQLRPEDKVTLVVYAGAAGTVLEPTAGNKKQIIKDAIENLSAGGSTAGGQGIELAYNQALKNVVKGGNNRVILCTDGDFNVGVSSDAAMQTLIEEKRKTGVFLSCLGFGMGNYKDNKMEIMADKGNGNYAYIDNILEAKKVFVNEFGGTLFTVAKDVKLQVEFNPNLVQAYRLIGYENRALRNEDFNDDTKDAGDIGSGHTVTALYEIVPKDTKSNYLAGVDSLKYQTLIPNKAAESNELLTVKIRYKQPSSDKSQKIEQVLQMSKTSFDKASENFRFAAAVAEFGLLLRQSAFKGTGNYTQVKDLAKAAKGKDTEGYREEFIQLVKKAELLKANN